MFGCLLVAGVLIGILAVTIPVAAPPPIPMRVQGQALDRGGSPLPFNTPIRTFVDGVGYSNESRVYNGAGSYAVLIGGNSKANPDISDTPNVQEGANLGDLVIFAAGDFTTSADVFREVVPWSPGAVQSLNLNLGSDATTPRPIKIGGIVAQPARGGDQFVLVCNPTASSVSLADYFLEGNAPGTYHGRNLSLTGALPPMTSTQVSLGSPIWLAPRGDALKLVYRNPRGPLASAGGMDIVVDRVEFNATNGGTLMWEPGNTILGDAPAPGVGRVLTRDASCTDTNDPTDFSLAIEPGLPLPNQPPTVLITSPTVGQQVQAATRVTFTWTLSDDIFRISDLHVWANVTIGNQSIPLLDAVGATSVEWTTPDITVPDALLRVDVSDPFDAHATTTRPFGITRQSPVALAIAVVIALVLLGFLVFGFLRARKLEGASPGEPRTAPAPSSTTPPHAPLPATGASGSPARKACPRCHTMVEATDVVCFFCGYKFEETSSSP